jgi:hypothetical protein
MPSLCDKAYDGVLCTFSTRTCSDSSWICQKPAAKQLKTEGKRCCLPGKTAWTVHRSTNLTLLGHSPPACQAGLLLGHLSSLHRKKRFTSFPSPAGMSLTKLPLGRNNSVMTSLFPPRESLVVTSRLGTGNSRTFFYGVRIIVDALR